MKNATIHAADPNNCLSIDPHTDPQFWLSPFVVMANDGKDESGNPDPTFANDPNLGFAQQNENNKTNVTVNWSSDCQLPAGELPAAVFDLFVGDPSVVMTTGNTTLLTPSSKPAGVSTSVPTHTTPVTWTPSNTAADPSGPGHKCLIARCYPFGTTLTDPALGVYASEDPHYAQHNLTIDVTDASGGAGHRIRIQTGNGGKEQQLFTIEVVTDLNPSRTVLAAALPGLGTISGFKQIAKKPARQIHLDLGNFGRPKKGIWERIEDAVDEVEDKIEEIFKGSGDDKIKAQVKIPSNFFAGFDLVVDPAGSNPGDAHIFHITQADERGRVQGGITAVLVTL